MCAIPLEGPTPQNNQNLSKYMLLSHTVLVRLFSSPWICAHACVERWYPKNRYLYACLHSACKLVLPCALATTATIKMCHCQLQLPRCLRLCLHLQTQSQVGLPLWVLQSQTRGTTYVLWVYSQLRLQAQLTTQLNSRLWLATFANVIAITTALTVVNVVTKVYKF